MFLSSCPGMGKDLLGDIEIIKDLDISCVASLVGKDELTELGAKNLSEKIQMIDTIINTKNNLGLTWIRLDLVGLSWFRLDSLGFKIG